MSRPGTENRRSGHCDVSGAEGSEEAAQAGAGPPRQAWGPWQRDKGLLVADARSRGARAQRGAAAPCAAHGGAETRWGAASSGSTPMGLPLLPLNHRHSEEDVLRLCHTLLLISPSPTITAPLHGSGLKLVILVLPNGKDGKVRENANG